jgi:hypothetical protein
VRLRAKIALTVDAHADGVPFQLAVADDESSIAGWTFICSAFEILALMWSVLASSS